MCVFFFLLINLKIFFRWRKKKRKTKNIKYFWKKMQKSLKGKYFIQIAVKFVVD